MYHSCSLIRSFGFHMFLTSFPFHSKTVRLYILPVFVLLVSSLGIDLISGSLSPLVLGVIPDARPPFRSSSRDVSIGVVLVHCRTHLPRVGPIVDPSSLSRHAI
jgi:hypothetical protein